MSNCNAATPAKQAAADANITPEVLQQFLARLMEIQRHYAFEFRSVKGDRQSEVIELVNKFAAKELNAK